MKSDFFTGLKMETDESPTEGRNEITKAGAVSEIVILYSGSGEISAILNCREISLTDNKYTIR